MNHRSQGFPSRRQFCQTALVGAAAVGLPRVATAKKTGTANPIVGVDGHRYEVNHNWAQLPEKYAWQTTHNVAVDSQGLVYVIHEGRLHQKDHPSIFVFDADGQFVRAFGEQFQGGGHGIETRVENGEEFLYVCNYQQQRSFAKLTTAGEQVWRKGAPMESGLYAEGEDQFPRTKDNPWGRNRFMPTNIAFEPTGGFFLADGYGGYCIHEYDVDGNWLRKFGKPSDKNKRDGEFSLPHGVWIDDRGSENDPLVVVADRANARLQWFDLRGEHKETLGGFLLPANIDVYGDTMLVPDLVGRVTLLDSDNQVITQLGMDTKRIQDDQKKHKGFHIRTDESTWLDGKFIHPHDACFDADGNIYVTEWVKRGRVTKLTRMV